MPMRWCCARRARSKPRGRSGCPGSSSAPGLAPGGKLRGARDLLVGIEVRELVEVELGAERLLVGLEALDRELTALRLEADLDQAPVRGLVLGLERHAAPAGLGRVVVALGGDQDPAAQVRGRRVLAADRALERAERGERALEL